jgi:hypothetical protein
VPKATIVDIPVAEQARMLAELRRARYGYLLALHLLLLCAAGRTPSEIAAVLFCSRSSVYRVVKAYRAGHRHEALSGEFYCQFDRIVLGLYALTQALGRGATFSGCFRDQAVRLQTHMMQESAQHGCWLKEPL